LNDILLTIMRPFRLLLSIFTCVILLTLLLYANFPAEASQAKAVPAPPQKKKGKIRALFSWTTPSSLFPPSAIISLTDDNSTFFLARPAAFGPLLPTRGLSGPLWVGSGFSDDALTHGGGVAGLEGELGCSDVPGWSDGNSHSGSHPQIGIDTRRKTLADSGSSASGKQRRKRGIMMGGVDNEAGPADEYDTASPPALDQNDGTDDYLHRPLGDSDTVKAPQKQPEHADIQSLQEGAEIAGKVVLLSRGGCGFLEKAKWAQRRGATALIVGDNIRGAPLITMYAHGDTSNVTIPSLFTSHTTAHLLSSLMPSGGGAFESSAPSDSIKLGSSAGKKTENTSKGKEAPKADTADSPAHTNPNMKTMQSSTSRPKGKGPQSSSSSPKKDAPKTKPQSPGLLKSLLSLLGLGSDGNTGAGTDNRRPPSSGGLDWVLVEDFVDERTKKTISPPKPTQTPDKQGKQTPSSPDDFVIGVQDWRDPDLLPQQTGTPQSKLSDKKEKPEDSNSQLKGGSILPGSGEYAKPANDAAEVGSASSTSSSDGQYDSPDENGRNRGWLSALQWGRDDDGYEGTEPGSSKRKVDVTEHPNMSRSTKILRKDDTGPLPNDPERHEGLWVTLTPTNMSSSPFFDTLLVLVVSPLVTLTVVYALLLLRSRIRRRRWRAPKSVVDRLPVRTYHTLPSDNSSPTTTPVTTSPTAPLLSQHRHHQNQQDNTNAQHLRSPTSRSRPRSRTTPEVPAQTSSSYQSRHRHGAAAVGARSPSPEAEKREAGLAEWRRRYGGRQKECVVCLEEYVDGVSRVMSLPCGHEFHAECM
jgi:hypothetical protein